LASRLSIVLATRNPGKIREIRAILGDLAVDLLTADDFPQVGPVAEDGLTFEANAVTKAAYIREHTGLVSLADDSGLEVDALGGRPGILSARFAGDKASYADNNRKLLDLLRDVPFEQRTARFVCVAALAVPGGDVMLKRGEVEGLITDTAAGGGGFGYDPIFYVPAYGKTVAQLDDATKNRISHRAKAFRAMAGVIGDLLKGGR